MAKLKALVGENKQLKIALADAALAYGYGLPENSGLGIAGKFVDRRVYTSCLLTLSAA
jgi:hypothetical protein